MKKRIISIFLCALLIVSLLPISAFALTELTITKQPKSVTVRDGDTATFSMKVNSDSDRLMYVWFNPDNIPMSTVMKLISKNKNKEYVSTEDISATEWISIGFELPQYDLANAAYGTGESCEVTVTSSMNGKKVQGAAVVFTDDSPESFDVSISGIGDLKKLKDYKIKAYAISEVVTIKIDPNAPCQTHDMSPMSAKAPTCTEDGWSEYEQCTGCDYNTKASHMIPATGHKPGDWETVRESTCTEAGELEAKCTVCGHAERKAAEIAPHQFSTKLIEAGCTAKGYTLCTCDVCGYSEKRDEVAAEGHKYSGGTCTVCGEINENFKLAAPKVTASNNSSTGKIKLTWDKVADAEKYEVFRSGTRNGTYSKMSTTTNTSYTNTTASAGSTYYYKVRAVSGDVYSEYSATVCRTCDLAAPVITASNNSSTGKVMLTWSKVSGASKYEVYRATSENGSYSKMSTTTGTSYTNTTSYAGNSYYYKVKAICSKTSDGNSAYSNTVSQICLCATPSVTASNDAKTGKVKLTWKAVDGASKYEIYRSGYKNGEYVKQYTTTKTSYTNSTSYAGSTYYYKVVAVCSKTTDANSADSKIVSRTCDCAAPVVKISANYKGYPQISWSSVYNADSYVVYRATSKNGSYTRMLSTGSTSYTNTSAKSGTTYYYKVVAVSNKSTSANSAYSNIVSMSVRLK